MADRDLDGVVALHKVSVPTDGRVCDLSVEIQTQGGDLNEPTIILKKYDQVEIFEVIAESELSMQGGGEWKPVDPSVFAGLPSGGYWALSVSDIDPVARWDAWTLTISAEGGDCNGNSIPDDCDIDQEVLADADGNDIPDICDNCPLIFNPDQTDSDTDGTASLGQVGHNPWLGLLWLDHGRRWRSTPYPGDLPPYPRLQSPPGRHRGRLESSVRSDDGIT